MPASRNLIPGLCIPLILAVLGILLCDQIAAADESSVDQSRFEATVLATGLIQPMELAVAPDGTIYFIELNGKLKSLHPVTHQVSLVGELTITTEQENGLLGLALDPNFADTQWIYLQYSPPTFSGQHISRFTLRDGKLDIESEKLLLRRCTTIKCPV